MARNIAVLVFNASLCLRRHAPGYETPERYEDTPAVSDDGVVTASGLGAVEFAHEIFAALGIFGAADLARYLDMYRRGQAPADL